MTSENQAEARARLEEFLAKYSPDVADLARDVLMTMRQRVPGAVSLVYDNSNALAIGFGGGERVSDVAMSVAVYPKWVNLCFFQGAHLPDPSGILKGAGRQARHVRLSSAADVARPEIEALIAQALDRARPPIDPTLPNRWIIKSISAKQRARR